MDDFENVFDEIFSDDTPAVEDSSEETTTTETPAVEPAETPAAATPLRFKHLTTEVEFDEAAVKPIADALGITPQETVARLQMGTDYPRVKAEREQMQPIFGTIKDFSTRTGTEIAQVEKIIGETLRLAAEQRAATAIRARHPEASEDIVREMAQSELEKQKLSEVASEKQQQDKQRQFITELWREFFAEFPQVDATSLPDPVKNSIRDGKTPREAYLEWQTADLKQKLAVYEKTEANRQKSVGSVKGTVGDSADDFDAYMNKLFPD